MSNASNQNLDRSLAVSRPVFEREISGTTSDDVFNGSFFQDLIKGNDGNDVISGGLDDDFLAGDRGHDILNGEFTNSSGLNQAALQNLSSFLPAKTNKSRV